MMFHVDKIYQKSCMQGHKYATIYTFKSPNSKIRRQRGGGESFSVHRIYLTLFLFCFEAFPTNVSIQMVIKNIHSLDEINMVCILILSSSELDLEPGAAIWQLTKNFDLLSHYRTFPWTSYYDRGGRTNAWSSNTIKLHLWNWTRK